MERKVRKGWISLYIINAQAQELIIEIKGQEKNCLPFFRLPYTGNEN